jgi:transposase-like protein
MSNPFRYFNSSPEVIRLVVMMYVRYPLSLRNVEDLLAERGRDIRYETVRFWWNRFGPMFAAEIRKRRSGTCVAILMTLASDEGVPRKHQQQWGCGLHRR